MNTAIIQIGNSDDKLTQEEWSQFVSDVQDIFTNWNFRIHFHGCSVGSAPWQNACWIIELNSGNYDTVARIEFIRNNLSFLASTYKQDSIALTIGDTEFVKG